MPLALPPPEIPRGPEELSPEWLTSALRGRGVIENARVTGFDSQVVGEGEGFVGTIIRLGLHYDVEEPAAPKSLIAKFPIGIANNRRVGNLLGAYEREVRFYEELAGQVQMRTPRCFFSAMDPNPFAGREEEGFALLGRVPSWAVRLVLPLLMWSAGRDKRRYVLFLEDLAPGRFGDQLAGCTPERAERVLRAAARMHAGYWGDASLDSRWWIGKVDTLPRFGQVLFRRSRSAFRKHYGERLPAHVFELVDWLGVNGPALIARMARCPQTLVHGDYRLDNMCFDDEGDFTCLDWQGPSQGPGEQDIAYFVSGNLTADVARECQDDLLRAYYDELVANGVRDHSFEACRHAYQLSVLHVAYRMIPIDLMDFDPGRGTELIDSWFERLAVILPERYEELVL